MYKHILHDHLDGGLDETCLELAKALNYKPILK